MGAQHCEAILSHDGIPVLLDINLSRLKKLKLRLDKKFSSDVAIYVVDITSEIAVQECAELVKKKFNTKLQGAGKVQRPKAKRSSSSKTAALLKLYIRP